MKVERDGADGTAVRITQSTSPVADALVVDGEEGAEVVGGTDIIADGRDVVLRHQPVTEVETKDAGMRIGQGGVVDADEGQLIIKIPPHDISTDDVAVAVFDFLAKETAGVELRDEYEMADTEVVFHGQADVGER